MSAPDRAALRALMNNEFQRHGLTARAPGTSLWFCKCGVEVSTDEHGRPMGRDHIVNRVLDVLLAEDAELLKRLGEGG